MYAAWKGDNPKRLGRRLYWLDHLLPNGRTIRQVLSEDCPNTFPAEFKQPPKPEGEPTSARRP
jgi:hypothetical protein